ncbi:MAG TPA: R3H domain-containing nucleic acid-binding protein [Candidatus Moranbacteria bacterium]|nr:R3H domain-containing nucleic acid-binding protein [Candidatus Moranbacteria bacterium]
MDNKEQEKNQEEKLEGIVGDFVKKMGFDCEVEAKKQKEDDKEMIICNIKTTDSNFLIGQYGVNLQSLQHIVRIIARKNGFDEINFILDVNSYRQERNDSIMKMAKNLADEAIAEKRAVVLRPMSPYERRLVHMELSKNDQIKTESIGEGEDRRVVIKPANLV